MTREQMTREEAIEHTLTMVGASARTLDAGAASTMTGSELFGALIAGCREQLDEPNIADVGTLAATALLTLARLIESGEIAMKLNDERNALQ